MTFSESEKKENLINRMLSDGASELLFGVVINSEPNVGRESVQVLPLTECQAGQVLEAETL